LKTWWRWKSGWWALASCVTHPTWICHLTIPQNRSSNLLISAGPNSPSSQQLG
jgi:hypothetical protein